MCPMRRRIHVSSSLSSLRTHEVFRTHRHTDALTHRHTDTQTHAINCALWVLRSKRDLL
jgi:hypothetical protein